MFVCAYSIFYKKPVCMPTKFLYAILCVLTVQPKQWQANYVPLFIFLAYGQLGKIHASD